ncbi:MAG TPA: hypothetical protein VHR66_18030 [Gemmataceae bacterium]|jgi:hypothetical protein|nr:hypothetical protein [Gemmataceae bacterium]
MFADIHFLTLAGTMLVLVGGAMAIWPRAVTSVSQDADGIPMPVTPANVRWMRLFGIAVLVLGIVCVASGLLGVKGDNDPVLI